MENYARELGSGDMEMASRCYRSDVNLCYRLVYSCSVVKPPSAIILVHVLVACAWDRIAFPGRTHDVRPDPRIPWPTRALGSPPSANGHVSALSISLRQVWKRVFRIRFVMNLLFAQPADHQVTLVR